MLDMDSMRRIAENLYVYKVTTSFGAQGADALRMLLDFLIQLYSRHDPAGRVNKLVVARHVHNRGIFSCPPQQVIHGVSQVSDQLDDSCCVILNRDGSMDVRQASSVDLFDLSASHIVYEYDRNSERFYIAGDAYDVINPSPTHASVFARPTYSSLTAALENYKQRVAQNSSCLILQDVWKDEKRIVFRQKPESTMRKSLNQFLSHVLQDAEVRPEQNVDETHPVDIKVTWVYSSQRAIVEIKWLGDSLGDSGSISTVYRDARALSGAQQLAEYLDSSATWGATVSTRGYLVVFDGRRRGVSDSTVQISREDGLHYKFAEIAYNPDYAALRSDFAPPMRMFMHPVTTEART